MLISQTELDSKGSRDPIPLECYQCGKTHYRTKNIVLRILNGNHYGTRKGCFCSHKCKHENKKITRIICQCKQCGNPFDRLPKDIKGNTFCSKSCAAIFNNTIYKLKVDIILKKCNFCKTDFTPNKKSQKYCCAACRSHKTKQSIFSQIESETYTFPWPKPYRDYLITKYGSKCMICGWDKLNSKTNKCPVQLDHIDGNHKNNKLNNLRLVCPNCHSLTPTYMALNRGNGRHYRRLRYAAGKSS